MHSKSRSSSVSQRQARTLFTLDSLESRMLLSADAILNAKVPISVLPQLNSLPGAPANLYLDFNGDVARVWNGSNVPAQKPWDNDGDRTTFNTVELEDIRDIWTVVADQYSPFNVNVTTVDPGADDVVGKTFRIVMGADSAWTGSTGRIFGISIYNGFTSGENWGYQFATGQSPRVSASTAAHEAGHGFGLAHEGEQVNGSWQQRAFTDPVGWIMGPPANTVERVLWWNGNTEFGAPQDDMAIIARSQNGFGYRPDDYGSTQATATPISLSTASDGTYLSASIKGVIHCHTDQDWFSFDWQGGPLTIGAFGAAQSESIDPSLELRAADGSLVGSVEDNNPGSILYKSNLPAGTYRVGVLSGIHADGSTTTRYGEAGQYTLRFLAGATDGQLPFHDAPIHVADDATTQIKYEEYDYGGQGIAYNEIDTGRTVNARVGEGADVQYVPDLGQYGGNFSGGEWVEYTIDVATTGLYDFDFLAKTGGSADHFNIKIDGTNVTNSVQALQSPYQLFQEVTQNGISLTAGRHVMRLTIEDAGTRQLNIDQMLITPAASGSANITVPSLAAAYVRDGSSATKNFGNDASLVVKKSPNAGNTRSSYLKFDLSSVSGNISSAKVRVYGKLSGTGSVPIQIRASDGSWVESSITYANAPGGTGAGLASENIISTNNRWYELDVTSFVKSEKAAGHNVVSFVLDATAASDPSAIFNSDEAGGNTPELALVTGNPQGLLVSPSSLKVNENGSNGFGVKLASAPSSNVTVNIARSSGDTDLIANVSTLTFTPANWNIEQTVTISALNDADLSSGTAVFTVSASGMDAQTVIASEVDDDGTPSTDHFSAQSAAYVRDGSYASTNFGSDTSLLVKNSPNVGNTRNTYVKFDLAGLSSTLTITSAKVRLFGKLSGSGSVPIRIRATDGSWTESTLKFSNAPAATSSALSTNAVGSTTAQWYDFDVTDFVKSEMALGHTVMSFEIDSTSASDPWVIFNSDEASTNPPDLAVTTQNAPASQAIVVSASSVSVPENGSKSITVKLASQPPTNVTVNIARQSGDSDLSASVAMLSFTSANWNIAQTVTFNAANDIDTTNGSAIFAISSSGLTTQNVTVTETDDDVTSSPPPTITSSIASYVRDGTYSTANYGSGSSLYVKQSGSAGNSREAYVTFDLAGVTTISNAVLRLQAKLSDSIDAKVAVDLFGATNTSWTENGLTWSNKSASGATPIGSTTVVGRTATFYDINLTSFLQSELAAGHTKVTIVLKGHAASGSSVVISSDETSNGPKLLLS